MGNFRSNLPLGTTDVKVLLGNSSHFDVVANSKEEESTPDRFGRARKTQWGMECDFQRFLINSGYQDMGDYVAGLELTARNQMFHKDGELYRASAARDLPYTLTGNWAQEKDLFVGMGDQVLRQQLSGSSGQTMIGLDHGTLYDAICWVTPEMFGAIGDGIADDTAALQDAIDYCAPYEWMGSLSETKKSGAKGVQAKLTGKGSYRVTRPIVINPFLVMHGSRGNGFFQPEKTGFSIIGDFDGKHSFVLDTAPFNSQGIRELGRSFTRNNWEGNDPSALYSSIDGFNIENILVKIPENRDVLGCFNRAIAIQSHVTKNAFIGGHISVRTSCTWGGSMRFNHGMAGSINFLNLGDVTCDDQRTNYLTVLPHFKENLSEFNPPDFPDPAIGAMTANIHCGGYSRPLLEGNVLEHGDIGVRAVSQSSLDVNCYFEGIKKYIVAAHTCSMDVKISTVFCPDAELYWFDGSQWDTLTFDFSPSVHSVNTIKGLGRQTQYVGGVRFLGSGSERIPKQFYSSRIDYSGILKNGRREIFVSDTGSDTASGLLSTLPVKTLSEAFLRCDPHAENIITLLSQVETKYIPSFSVAVDSVRIEGGGNRVVITSNFSQVAGLPTGIKSISIRNTRLSHTSTETVDPNYSAVIPIDGLVDVELIDVVSSNTGNVKLIGAPYQRGGFARVSARGGALSGRVVVNRPDQKFGCSFITSGADVSGATPSPASAFSWTNLPTN